MAGAQRADWKPLFLIFVSTLICFFFLGFVLSVAIGLSLWWLTNCDLRLATAKFRTWISSLLQSSDDESFLTSPPMTVRPGTDAKPDSSVSWSQGRQIAHKSFVDSITPSSSPSIRVVPNWKYGSPVSPAYGSVRTVSLSSPADRSSVVPVFTYNEKTPRFFPPARTELVGRIISASMFDESGAVRTPMSTSVRIPSLPQASVVGRLLPSPSVMLAGSDKTQLRLSSAKDRSLINTANTIQSEEETALDRQSIISALKQLSKKRALPNSAEDQDSLPDLVQKSKKSRTGSMPAYSTPARSDSPGDCVSSGESVGKASGALVPKQLGLPQQPFKKTRSKLRFDISEVLLDHTPNQTKPDGLSKKSSQGKSPRKRRHPAPKMVDEITQVSEEYLHSTSYLATSQGIPIDLPSVSCSPPRHIRLPSLSPSPIKTTANPTKLRILAEDYEAQMALQKQRLAIIDSALSLSQATAPPSSVGTSSQTALEVISQSISTFSALGGTPCVPASSAAPILPSPSAITAPVPLENGTSENSQNASGPTLPVSSVRLTSVGQATISASAPRGSPAGLPVSAAGGFGFPVEALSTMPASIQHTSVTSNAAPGASFSFGLTQVSSQPTSALPATSASTVGVQAPATLSFGAVDGLSTPAPPISSAQQSVPGFVLPAAILGTTSAGMPSAFAGTAPAAVIQSGGFSFGMPSASQSQPSLIGTHVVTAGKSEASPSQVIQVVSPPGSMVAMTTVAGPSMSVFGSSFGASGLGTSSMPSMTTGLSVSGIAGSQTTTLVSCSTAESFAGKSFTFGSASDPSSSVSGIPGFAISSSVTTNAILVPSSGTSGIPTGSVTSPSAFDFQLGPPSVQPASSLVPAAFPTTPGGFQFGASKPALISSLPVVSSTGPTLTSPPGTGGGFQFGSGLNPALAGTTGSGMLQFGAGPIATTQASSAPSGFNFTSSQASGFSLAPLANNSLGGSAATMFSSSVPSSLGANHAPPLAFGAVAAHASQVSNMGGFNPGTAAQTTGGGFSFGATLPGGTGGFNFAQKAPTAGGFSFGSSSSSSTTGGGGGATASAMVPPTFGAPANSNGGFSFGGTTQQQQSVVPTMGFNFGANSSAEASGTNQLFAFGTGTTANRTFTPARRRLQKR